MRLPAICLLLTCAILAAPAMAADGVAPKIFIEKLFGKAPASGRANVCVNRVYDAPHMAAHPQQKVTAMMAELSALASTDGAGPQISFSIAVKIRGSAKRFTSGGGCSLVNSAGLDNGLVDQLRCSVDCDGGGITFRLPRDNTSIMTELDNGDRLSLSAGADMEHGITLVRGADDRLFRLDRTSLRQCLPIVLDEDVQASIRKSR